jgi:ADP-heptose:LPS heptosyltransferase
MPHVGQSGTFYQNILARKGEAKVCVIRKVGGIGDVLMVTPALRQLKRDYPDIHLTYALDMHTTGNNVYYESMKNCPFVDQLVDARFVKHGEYDAVVDVSAVCIRYERSELPPVNRVDLFSKAMGLRIVGDKRSWYQVEASEATWAKAQVASYRSSGKKIVVLHTASMEGKRCWPIDKYIEMIDEAKEEQLAVQFVILDFNSKYGDWGAHDNCVDFSRTTIREMAALIQEADVFIGPDSGPMHIAGAVGTQSLVLFGSIPPEARINYYPTHKAIALSGLSCLGCWYKQCPYDVKCMRDIDAMHVYKKMRAIL